MAWYNFFKRKAPSPKKAEPPKPKALIRDLREKIEAQEPFTLVYIVVDEGDSKYIEQLVGGKSTGSGIGVIANEGEHSRVYSTLEKLADAPFQSSIRCGHADYSGDNNQIRPTRLINAATMSYIRQTYEGKTPPERFQEGLEVA